MTALLESFASLSKDLGGSIGLAHAPVGLRQPVTSLGELRSGVGWSTMKIPVAIAAVSKARGHPGHDSPDSPDTHPSRGLAEDMAELMRLAITESDNDAAMALWSGLGSPAAAAAQTEAILREGGDATTVVPSERLRPEFTPFGQSRWSLAAQATFAASLPGMAHAGPVLELMGQVMETQRWGIGSLSATVAFKGGWGPGADGGYLVRQMAVVRVQDGSRLGVALATLPVDGRFDTGVTDLDALAAWFAANIHAGGPSRAGR